MYMKFKAKIWKKNTKIFDKVAFPLFFASALQALGQKPCKRWNSML